MSRVIYSTQKVPGHKGTTTKNPREFQHPVEGATEVYIAGDWPLVREAYSKMKGVSVKDISQLKSASDAKTMTKG